MARALGFGERWPSTAAGAAAGDEPGGRSVTALVFAYSLANTFLVESVFDWPGLGSYAADSIAGARHAGDHRRDAVRGHRLRHREPARGHRAGRRRPADRGCGERDRPAAESRPRRARSAALRRNPPLVAGGVDRWCCSCWSPSSRRWIAPYPADAGNATHPCTAAGAALVGASLRHRPGRPRPLQPGHVRRPHLAAHRGRGAGHRRR